MVDTKNTETPQDKQPAAKPVVDEGSKLVTPKRKYFYPESGRVAKRAVAKPSIKTKSTNEETK